MTNIDLSAKTFLVTGATDGLGRALTGELAAANATVLLHGRDRERARETEDEIRCAQPARSLRRARRPPADAHPEATAAP